MITQNFADNNIAKKQKSLNEIEIEIDNLENELRQQQEAQKKANQQLESIKAQIISETKKLNQEQNQEQKKAQLLQNAQIIVDSLKNNSLFIENQKNDLIKLIKTIKNKNKELTNQIIVLNDSLVNIKKNLDNTLEMVNLVQKEIKLIIKETMLINPPNNIEFIIESNTWDDFILQSILYNMLITNKGDKIEALFNKKESINKQYNQDLNLQNQIIQDRKNINSQIKEYEKTTERLNINLVAIKELIFEKEKILKNIQAEYNAINLNLNLTENKIINLKNEKREIQTNQKKVKEEKQRLEYSLVLKKQSRDKIEQAINKLLAKKSEYQGTNIAKFKNQLSWPMEGNVITKFGINISPTGAKFDYTFIEMVGDEVLYLTNEINPKKPNKNLVKKFQQLTMGLKKSDTGYGVFGPRTTQEWKKYNQIQKNDQNKQPITAIHEGKIEEIKFIDPITGVLIIIRHNDQSFSTYSGHIDVIVQKNDLVYKNQKIGFINNEDILAFHLLINGQVVNPEKWFHKK